MRSTAFYIFAFLMLSVPAFGKQTAANDIELLSSTLITKLHFDRNPRKAQMVGALQVSFRNITNAPLTKVQVLLNPGLRFERISGPGNQALGFTNGYVAIEGLGQLELNAAILTLASPLAPQKRVEIAIHYRGFLENLSFVGLDGVPETLDPDFTMLRAQSFAYPVFSRPDKLSIEAAWNHKPFQQFAFVEYPGQNSIVATLPVVGKTIDAGKNNAELKAKGPTRMLAIAIAPYETATEKYVSVLHRANNAQAAQFLAREADKEAEKFASRLGPPPKDTVFQIAETPDTYRTDAAAGISFKPASFFAAPTVDASMKKAIGDLWRFNTAGTPDHWADGLDGFISSMMLNPQKASLELDAQFAAVKSLVVENKTLGKTALADFAIDGFSDEQALFSRVAFATLHDITGSDVFFGLMRDVRRDLRGSYRDLSAIADYLADNVSDKKARRFVENWFAGGKAGKDIAKAKNFADLVSRYK